MRKSFKGFTILLLAWGLMFGVWTVTLTEAADLEYSRKVIEKYSVVPEFIAPGPAFDARACMAGKRILSIPTMSPNPFCQALLTSMRDVAKRVGIELMEWENQGQPAEWVQGVNYAISQKFDMIDLLAGSDPRVLQPQIKAARAEGIMVFTNHISDITQPVVENITGDVPVAFSTAGRILVNWAIVKTGGKVNALVLGSDEAYCTKPFVDAIKDEFATRCPEGKMKYVNVAIPEWTSRIQPVVQSAIMADPTLNYVIPIYDSMSQFCLPALTLTGTQDRIKIATFNGTPFVLGLVQQGKVEMDIGENLDWAGKVIMDQMMRAVCGLEFKRGAYIPLYIFDRKNTADLGTPPEPGAGFGTEYLEGFNKLWKLE